MVKILDWQQTYPQRPDRPERTGMIYSEHKQEKHAAKNTQSSQAIIENKRKDLNLPGQTKTERICKHQTSSIGNTKRGL